MDSIYIGRGFASEVVIVEKFDANDVRKSGPGGEVVRTTVTRFTQKGRGEMTANEKFRAGGRFMADVPETVELVTDQATLRDIRGALLLKGGNTLALFDQGRAAEADVLKCFPSAEVFQDGQTPDADGNRLEPMRKSEPTLFGPESRRGHSLITKAYREAAASGDISLREAAAELDAMAERMRQQREG